MNARCVVCSRSPVARRVPFTNVYVCKDHESMKESEVYAFAPAAYRNGGASASVTPLACKQCDGNLLGGAILYLGAFYCNECGNNKVHGPPDTKRSIPIAKGATLCSRDACKQPSKFAENDARGRCYDCNEKRL